MRQSWSWTVLKPHVMLFADDMVLSGSSESEGVFTTIGQLIWSESADELLPVTCLPVCIFALVWFGFTHTRCQGNQKIYQQRHMGAVILFTCQKSRLSDPLFLSCSLNIFNTIWFSYSFFLAVGLCGCLPKKSRWQHISLLLKVNPHLYLYIYIYLYLDVLSPSCTAQLAKGGWFSPKIHNSYAAGVNRDRITFTPQMNCTRVRLNTSSNRYMHAQTHHSQSQNSFESHWTLTFNIHTTHKHSAGAKKFAVLWRGLIESLNQFLKNMDYSLQLFQVSQYAKKRNTLGYCSWVRVKYRVKWTGRLV